MPRKPRSETFPNDKKRLEEAPIKKLIDFEWDRVRSLEKMCQKNTEKPVAESEKSKQRRVKVALTNQHATRQEEQLLEQLTGHFFEYENCQVLEETEENGIDPSRSMILALQGKFCENQFLP